VTHVELTTPDGSAEAYVTGSGPGVLLYIDAIGLRPQIEQMAERIAGWGFTVLAPNVLYRSGTAAETSPAPGQDLREPGQREEFFRSVGPRLGALTPDAVRRDAPVWLAALREHAEGEEVGVVGYCMGARLAVRTAAVDPGVVAVAGFHGGGLAVEDDPDSPHLLIEGTHAEYVFGHGDQDRNMGPDAVARLQQALDAAGVTSTNEIYPGSPHGYSMNDTSMYDERGAERSFEALHGLLDRTLRD
jgi:carboxymethylenebutenolidase